MKEEKFSSLEELYKRLLPALSVKKKEMSRAHMILIEEKDIWSYFCQKVWSKRGNLTLGEMVDDILNTDNFQIYETLRKE